MYHLNRVQSTQKIMEPDEDRHVGDFGNVTADKHGNVQKSFMSDLVKLKGKTSVIGRSFVIHEGIDDLGRGENEESLKTGNGWKNGLWCHWICKTPNCTLKNVVDILIKNIFIQPEVGLKINICVYYIYPIIVLILRKVNEPYV